MKWFSTVLLLLLMISLSSMEVFAETFSAPAPAPAPGNMQMYREQPDGTVITLFMRGDERLHWLVDAKDRFVVQRSDGWYVYGKGWLYRATTGKLSIIPQEDLIVGKAHETLLVDLPKSYYPFVPGVLVDL